MSKRSKYPWKLYRLRYRMRHRPACTRCGGAIPYSTVKGKRFCSAVCRVTTRLEAAKAQRDCKLFGFLREKERIGCKQCGYKAYGGALDYHHTNSAEKERRIVADQWWNKTKSFLTEIRKCVLVCKNCHYRLHEEMRAE